MIRPFTCLCLLAAFGSGLYLYSEKHRTVMLDREIGRVVRTTQAARASTGLLRAEWALLNEPGRLQDMAGKYLALKTMAPTQFVQLADLASRLPAPVAAPAAGSTDEDEAAPQEAPPVIAEVPPAPPPPSASPKPQAKLLAHADTKPKPQHHMALADRQDGLMRGTPLPLAAPQPMGATVFSAMARPMHTTAPRPVIVAAAPSYPTAAPYVGSAPSVGSALGGRASLPPPVPYGSPDR